MQRGSAVYMLLFSVFVVGLLVTASASHVQRVAHGAVLRDVLFDYVRRVGLGPVLLGGLIAGLLGMAAWLLWILWRMQG
ncbi:MAG: hypothetical protein ABIR55_05300 [Burkholderiaceae bacterium]